MHYVVYRNLYNRSLASIFFFAPQGVASKKAMPILGGGLYFNGLIERSRC